MLTYFTRFFRIEQLKPLKRLRSSCLQVRRRNRDKNILDDLKVSSNNSSRSFAVSCPQGPFASSKQKHYPYLGSNTSSARSFCSGSRETSSGVAKCRLFSQATLPFYFTCLWADVARVTLFILRLRFRVRTLFFGQKIQGLF